MDSTGSIIPLVIVSVPHRRLVFRREGEFYAAGLGVRVAAKRGQRQVGGGVAEGAVTVESYAATKTNVPLEVSVPLLVRGHEAVALDVAAQVKGTSRIWKRRLTHTPQSLAVVPLWISGLHSNLKAASDDGLIITADMDSVRLTVTLERRREDSGWPDGGIDLVSEITGASLNEPLRQRTPISVFSDSMKTAAFTHTWPVVGLPLGRLRLRVLLDAEQAGQRWQLPREPALEALSLSVPVRKDRDWRRHISWLDGLLPAAVRDSMRALEPDCRAEAWSEIWRLAAVAEGLSPEMAERSHLRRIIDADERFGGFGRGALSDRGRVLIRWGEPATIDVFYDERASGAVYEVWIYTAEGMRFVFYDAHGMGDFRLSRTESLVR